MENYTIALLKDLVREACQEHKIGLAIRDFFLFEDPIKRPQLFYQNTKLTLYGWDIALKFYQKMRNPNNHVYCLIGFPCTRVTYTPAMYLTVAESIEEAKALVRDALLLTRSQKEDYEFESIPLYLLKPLTPVIV